MQFLTTDFISAHGPGLAGWVVSHTDFPRVNSMDSTITMAPEYMEKPHHRCS